MLVIWIMSVTTQSIDCVGYVSSSVIHEEHNTSYDFSILNL